jgi:hypothetical protein
MTISLTSLLQRVPSSVESRVKSTRDRSRAALRDALRTECRLVMRGADEMDERGTLAQVNVEVVPGYPEILKTLTFPDTLEHVLLLTRFRHQLADAASGTKGLIDLHRAFLRLPNTDQWIPATDQAFQDTNHWATEMLQRLEKEDPVGTVLAVHEDILGAYICDSTSTDEFAVNRATIRLYWGVIGLVSEWLGCTVEDLTVVVLAHELAHAYSQLGADIEGRRWPSKHFAAAETALKEGLAQYYTERSLERLKNRFPGAITTFGILLKKQSGPYHAHEPWRDNFSPEAVRRAMIEIRRWGEGKVAQFQTRLEKAAEELQPLRDGLFE